MHQRASPSLDHLVLPTGDLRVARDRLVDLGFTVAPEGVHPFGTHNLCVYFQDGTFLEALAVNDQAVARQAIDDGNVFVARDRKFRDISGDEGFSAVVLASADADADDRRFEASGIRAGRRLDFARSYVDAEGTERKVSFRLAFAAQDEDQPAFFFTCERVNPRASGRGALAVHPNAVAGISRIVATSADPGRDADFLAQFAGSAAQGTDGALEIVLSGTTICVMDDAGFAERFGVEPVRAGSGLCLSGIAFRSSDERSCEAALARSGVFSRRRGGIRVVQPVPGQGAVFIFEDAKQ